MVRVLADTAGEIHPIPAACRHVSDLDVYILKAFDHPVLDAVRVFGACALKEETPTGSLYVFLEPHTSDFEKQRIHREVTEACPGRRVYLCVRARVPKCRPSSMTAEGAPAPKPKSHASRAS